MYYNIYDLYILMIYNRKIYKMSESEPKKFTKETVPSSWKCEPLNLNEDEIKEAFKDVKFFQPSYEYSINQNKKID